MTTIIGYAVLAIELEDAETAAQLYAILEPFGDEVSFSGITSQGPISAYLGKLASVIGRHDVADAHLQRALDVARAFGWRYHEATTLVALALSQKRRTGALDDTALAWLDEAMAIGVERDLPGSGSRPRSSEADRVRYRPRPGRATDGVGFPARRRAQPHTVGSRSAEPAVDGGLRDVRVRGEAALGRVEQLEPARVGATTRCRPSPSRPRSRSRSASPRRRTDR